MCRHTVVYEEGAVLGFLIPHNSMHIGDSAPSRPSCHLAEGMTSHGDCNFKYKLSSLVTLVKIYSVIT